MTEFKITKNHETQILMFYLMGCRHNNQITWRKKDVPGDGWLAIIKPNQWYDRFSCYFQSQGPKIYQGHDFSNDVLCEEYQLQSIKDDVGLGFIFVDDNSGDVEYNRSAILDGAIESFYYTPEDWEARNENKLAYYLRNYGFDFFFSFLADLIRIKAEKYCETWLTETGTFWDADEILGGTLFCLECYKEDGECQIRPDYKYNFQNRWGTTDRNPISIEVYFNNVRFKIYYKLY